MGSELYQKLGIEYLENVIKISKNISLSRAKRSITIAGRKEGESVSFGQLLYVPLQVADIYGLKVNLSHAGMDQRKAHVVAMDVAKTFNVNPAPIAVHHKLLSGIHITELQRQKIIAAKTSGDRERLDQELIDIKMSKSNPNSAIFIHDNEEEITRKILGAFCPAKEITVNPILDMANLIILPNAIRKNTTFEITNKKTNETKTFESQNDLEKEYLNGGIHPSDLKSAVAMYLIDMLAPIREYFSKGSGQTYLEELQQLKITR